MKLKKSVLILIVLISIMTLSGCTEKTIQKTIAERTNVYPDIDSAFASGQPVIVYFYDSFCTNCKNQQPIAESISDTVGNRGAIVVMDRNLNEAFANEHGIDNAPNMLVFNAEGKVISTGYLNSEKLDAFMDGI